MPTELKTLRSRPVHCGHSVRASSLKDCTVSNPWPHSVQAYWYVGTDVLPAFWHSRLTSANDALAPVVSQAAVGQQ
jgi:hypothetical protein